MLDLDDDIRKYLPEIPKFESVITIRHLLTHTSGLRNFQDLLSLAGWREGDPMTNEDLLRFMAKQKELNFPVGSEYLYCNSGFVLATFIVERTTGQDFKDWTRKNIFEPLQMDHTGYREDMTLVYHSTANSYNQLDDGSYIQPMKFFHYMGNGNIYTTISDVGQWISNLSTGMVGGEEGIQTLTTRGILNSGDTLSYALGIGVTDFHGHRRWSHSGSIGGYRSSLMFFPEENLGLIILSNFSQASLGIKSAELARHLLEIPPENKAEKVDIMQPSPKTIPTDLEAFQMYAGSYLIDDVVVDFYARDTGIYLHADGITPELTLQASSDTSYHVPGGRVSVYFERQSSRVTILRSGGILRGTRILADRAILPNIEGSYFSPELETWYVIAWEGDQLVANHQRHGYFNLYPISEDRMRGSKPFFSDIQIVRWPSGEVRGLRVSNGRVRNLWFDFR